MDKLKNMAIFTAIVDHGSLSSAANALGRSVATVTRGLAELEQHLGVRLINRSTRSLSVTQEGLEYVTHCRQLLAQIQTVESQLDRRKNIPTGKLVVTAPVMFGRMHLAPLLYQWLGENSKLQAELMLLDRTVDLLEEGFDLALRIGKLEDSNLVAIPLGTVSKICCASPELIAQQGQVSHPQELSDWPVIAFTSEGEHWRFQEERQCKRIKIKPLLSCNQIEPIIEAARNGLGAVYVRSYQVAPYISSGELVQLFPGYTTEQYPIQFVLPNTRLLSPRVRTFLDWAVPKLRENLNSELAWSTPV